MKNLNFFHRITLLSTASALTLGLVGCGGPFQYKANPQNQSSVEEKSGGLQIQISNQMSAIKTQSSDGRIKTETPDINAKVCASTITDEDEDKRITKKSPQSRKPSNRHCINLEGTVVIGKTEYFWLSSQEVQKLHAIDNGKITFFFRDAAQYSTLYYSCWDSDVVLNPNTQSKQEIELEVIGRGGNLSYDCNLIKVK